MAQDLSQLRQDRRIAVGIFFLVLAVYFLTFLGAPKSPDERALFSGIDSLVKRGDFKVNQIYWDYSNVAMETTDGEMVPNYEPAQMILAIPFYLWGRSLGAALQGVMFFNALVTAASVALLYLCFLELGYRRRTATLGALVYAFATLAWPYSRVFFREPLTVLAYLLAVYALLRYRAPAPRRLLWPALAGAGRGPGLHHQADQRGRLFPRWRCWPSPTNGAGRRTLEPVAACGRRGWPRCWLRWFPWPPSCCWARSISRRHWAGSRPSPATSSSTPPTRSFPARCRSACCAAGWA